MDCPPWALWRRMLRACFSPVSAAASTAVVPLPAAARVMVRVLPPAAAWVAIAAPPVV